MDSERIDDEFEVEAVSAFYLIISKTAGPNRIENTSSGIIIKSGQDAYNHGGILRRKQKSRRDHDGIIAALSIYGARHPSRWMTEYMARSGGSGMFWPYLTTFYYIYKPAGLLAYVLSLPSNSHNLNIQDQPQASQHVQHAKDKRIGTHIIIVDLRAGWEERRDHDTAIGFSPRLERAMDFSFDAEGRMSEYMTRSGGSGVWVGFNYRTAGPHRIGTSLIPLPSYTP
ncbi:hypothetical protein M422DRAFT_238713 [Sphaerobolus stellatus SS14]|nr:hypothetical protein M422DRAFT_238713 [Sphaerobolus stellatus SS14]